MKHAIKAAGFILGAVCVVFFAVAPLRAQTCQDEETMVQDSKKTINDLVDTVKKENLQDFENKFHQKTSLSDLTFAVSLVGELVTCLEKASQDSTATKDQVAAAKAKHDGYAKLKERLDQDRTTLKSQPDPKAAKGLVEKIDLSG